MKINQDYDQIVKLLPLFPNDSSLVFLLDYFYKDHEEDKK